MIMLHSDRLISHKLILLSLFLGSHRETQVQLIVSSDGSHVSPASILRDKAWVWTDRSVDDLRSAHALGPARPVWTFCRMWDSEEAGCQMFFGFGYVAQILAFPFPSEAICNAIQIQSAVWEEWSNRKEFHSWVVYSQNCMHAAAGNCSIIYQWSPRGSLHFSAFSPGVRDSRSTWPPWMRIWRLEIGRRPSLCWDASGCLWLLHFYVTFWQVSSCDQLAAVWFQKAIQLRFGCVKTYMG